MQHTGTEGTERMINRLDRNGVIGRIEIKHPPRMGEKPKPVGHVRLVVLPVKKTIVPVNPYSLLPDDLLEEICDSRDVELPSSREDRIFALEEYDKVLSSWRKNIETHSIDKLCTLRKSQIAFFGALRGVNYREAYNRLTIKDLISYTRIMIWFYEGNLIPHHFNDVEKINAKVLVTAITNIGVPVEYIPFLSRNELQRILLNGEIGNIPEEVRAMASRYCQLRDNPWRNNICDLYGLADDERSLVQISRISPHPLESTILSLENLRDEDIIRGLKMQIPRGVDKRDYIIANISQYRWIYTRNMSSFFSLQQLAGMSDRNIREYLRQLTDDELYSQLGAFVPYLSRESMIERLVSLFTTPSFFFPLIRDRSRYLNTETISGSLVSDRSTFVIAFGTIYRHHLYEFDDLLGSFYFDSESGIFAFRHPENPREEYSISEINSLILLLSASLPDYLADLISSYPPMPIIRELTKRVIEGMESLKERASYDGVARNQIRKLPGEEYELVRLFLYALFNIGMYMRRWKGPPHPYPLDEKSTLVKNMDPQPSTIAAISGAINILDSMLPSTRELCMNLCIIEYNGANLHQSRQPIRSIWDAVGKGDYCIRMASSQYVGTAYHYLRVLYLETIPDFNKERLDQIS